jgi:hypothetical protein
MACSSATAVVDETEDEVVMHTPRAWSLWALLAVGCGVAGSQGAKDRSDSSGGGPDSGDTAGLGDSGDGPWDSGQGDSGQGDDTGAVDADGDGFVAGVDCDDTDPLLHPEVDPPTLELDACGRGETLAEVGDASAWEVVAVHGDGTGVTISTGDESCSGQSLSIDWTLGEGESWVVLRRALPSPIDLSAAGWLYVPFQGDPAAPHVALEVKLEDADGCRALHRFDGVTDLEPWRTMVLGRTAFSVPDSGRSAEGACTLDRSRVSAVQVAISDAVGGGGGRLRLGDVTTAERDPWTPEAFSCPVADPDDARGRMARALLDRQEESLRTLGHALVPTWDGESPPRYYVYSLSMILALFSAEYHRTGDLVYREAADRLAMEFVNLPLDESGTWADGYVDGVDGLEPIDDGVEAGWTWYGNVSWSLIGLRRYLTLVQPEEPAPFEAVMIPAGDYLLEAIAAFGEEHPDYIGAVTLGTEGCVSTYFGLVAVSDLVPGAAEAAEAQAVALIAHAWNAEEQRLNIGLSDPGIAIDVTSAWGSQFLRHRGLVTEALAAQATALAVFPVTSFDGRTWGLGDLAGPIVPSWEFHGQALASGAPASEELMATALPEERDGVFPGAPDNFSGNGGWSTTWTGSSPTTWMYFALNGGFLERFPAP